jgi:T-complex protein 1 subunit zeta
VTDAVLCVRKEGEPIDLHMVERLHMLHRTEHDSRLVKGLVLDHGSRHPDMPSYVENGAPRAVGAAKGGGGGRSPRIRAGF